MEADDAGTDAGESEAPSKQQRSAAATARRGVTGRHRGRSAIDDARYEDLLALLRGEQSLVGGDHKNYKFYLRAIEGGRLRAERRFDAALGEELWRVVDSESGRIVPRLSDVPRVLAFFYEANGRPGARTLMGLCNRSYCGIGKPLAKSFIARQDIHCDALRFRQARPHRLEAAKPMQHVQIDVVDMPEVGYGAKSYGHLLVVQCMFSRFVFARALPVCERSLLTRHLMDVFGTFGPPEAVQTLSGNACIDASMPDIARMFKVEIECYGCGVLSSATTHDQFELRQKLVERSAHWPEVLPIALMERNMQPHAAFAMKRTPFAAMFGRQPWSGDTQPPWIEEDRRDVQHADLHERSPLNAAGDDVFGRQPWSGEPWFEENGRDVQLADLHQHAQLINNGGDEPPVEMFEMDGSVGVQRLLDADAAVPPPLWLFDGDEATRAAASFASA